MLLEKLFTSSLILSSSCGSFRYLEIVLGMGGRMGCSSIGGGGRDLSVCGRKGCCRVLAVRVDSSKGFAYRSNGGGGAHCIQQTAKAAEYGSQFHGSLLRCLFY